MHDPDFKFNPEMFEQSKSFEQEMEELVDLIVLDATRLQQTWMRVRERWREQLRKLREPGTN